MEVIKGRYLALIAAMSFSSSVFAADIATDVRSGPGGYDNSDGGYFEFGVGVNFFANKEAIVAETDIVLAGAYRYRRFFFEALSQDVSLNTGNASGLTLGVNLWRNDRWVVDLLGASTTGRLSSRISLVDFSNSENPERDKDVFRRDSFYNGAGVRLTGYFGNTIFQFRLVDDVYTDHGIIGSARVGYSKQVKNWSYHGVLSANYASSETSQYWYGVSAEEASTLFPEHDARSSTISYSTEIGASYPLREHVVFRTTALYTQLDDEVTSSPLQEGDFRVRWNTSLSYVF